MKRYEVVSVNSERALCVCPIDDEYVELVIVDMTQGYSLLNGQKLTSKELREFKLKDE